MVTVTAIVEQPRVRHLPVGDSLARRAPAASETATLLDPGSVIALHRRPTIALGALGARTVLSGDRLVSARDGVGHASWIPADAVWSDAGADAPEHPRPIGLATARTWQVALVKGLSDRLGWEAVLEFERGTELPAAPRVDGKLAANAIVLDGRLGHAVPTVVVLAADTMRWGAATTWEGAVRRALYADDQAIDADGELDELDTLLDADGLAVAGVDLGTGRLAAAGVSRCSAQIVVGRRLGTVVGR